MGMSNRPWADFAMAVLDMIFEFFAEEADAADNGAGGRIAEGAEGLSADVIANIDQQIDILLAALAMLQALQNLGQPVGSFAARRAFATGLVAVELTHAQDSPNDAGVLVDNDQATGTEHRASRTDGLEIQRRIHFIRAEHGR